ncbi:DUF2572 family protein [Desulfosporosinus meridiei]|uniref:Uncharacterized protein n=1 Tax=Desulfosporosinus meridiei (strain ATCC BAA-275 / DSM 13257 / KCTC 12902 / NCIMB 13706 / S10) TaxID=768704 RepID=J7IS44_DESMD|nr:DUF2572 family protein [Desulfosporosinus meridiei]AFQ43009.1 Protein of unknown function (DUF2572) [Desulfosporosinus meridiei DSM 13257]
MKFGTRLNLKSEKGNALLMALAVIFILTSFGTVSLMTSVANVKMSGKYKSWSKDYSILDTNAETKVNQINSILEEAESNAQKYMDGQYYLSSMGPSGDLEIPDPAQKYINGQWSTWVKPYLGDMESEEYKNYQPIFVDNILTRLYYYYASKLLNNNADANGYALLTQIDGSDIGLTDYQSNLFSSSTQILNEGNLAVKLQTNTIKDKVIAVRLIVNYPTYEPVKQTKVVVFKGNPIWTNAITAAGSIGFINGSSTIKGDLFSADKEESLYLNDNHVKASGIYSDGAQVSIYGNVYSKGNLHTIRSNSKMNIYKYPTENFSIDLKSNVFAKNIYPGLFFEDDLEKYPISTKYTYVEPYPVDSSDDTLYFINQDIIGGNIYCNSLSVDRTVDDKKVDNAEIYAHGNVSTWNDIKMNNSIPGSLFDGKDSKITVAKNFIGINAEGHNGDPNASSTVINNTALSGNTITLNGKMIVPGTAWAEYAGVKKNGWERFWWPGSKSNPINPWLSYQYYQTGESITAKNADIYSAYLSPVEHPVPSYNYSYEPYTIEAEPDSYVEANINSYYLMRGDNTSGSDTDSLIPKKSQLTDFINSKKLSGGKVVSNIFSGGNVTGYALGEALLHRSKASTVTVHGEPISNLPDDLQPHQIIDNADYHMYYFDIQSTLSKIFLSKVQNLGTLKKMPVSFEGFIDPSEGYRENLGRDYEDYVDKSAVKDINGNLLHSNPAEMTNAFVYLELPSSGETNILNISDSFSGIIYCEGNLKITGSGNFNGAIIAEGNITVVNDASISYDEEVIQNVLEKDNDAYCFFSKLSSFENQTNKSKGFIDKSAIFNSDGSLRSWVKTDPTGMQKNFIYFKNNNSTLHSGNYQGIIYCEGNLNIENGVTLNGAIICEGNVTVEGGSTITYDEKVIKNVLKDANVRRFFAPGEMGSDIISNYTTTASDGAVRLTNVKRFQIVEWKEEQQ